MSVNSKYRSIGKRRRGPANAQTQRDSKSVAKEAKRLPERITVDSPWSRNTWAIKASRTEMLRLLREAGEDTSAVEN
jgi:hypothetical protein